MIDGRWVTVTQTGDGGSQHWRLGAGGWGFVGKRMGVGGLELKIRTVREGRRLEGGGWKRRIPGIDSLRMGNGSRTKNVPSGLNV